MELLMNLVGAAIALHIIVLGINYFPKTRAFLRPDALIPNPLSKELWLIAFKSKKWRNKILFTLLVIWAYRLGYYLPLPGVSPKRIQEIISLMYSGGTLPPFTMVVLPGGPLDQCRLFALGIMPFLTACGLLQLIGFVIPPLRRKFYQGQAGFFQVRKLTVWLAYLLAATVGFFSAQWYANFEFQGVRLIPHHTWLTLLIIIISWVGGFSLIFWMANLISRYGIGNGWAVLFGTDILSRLVTNIYWFFHAFYKQQNVQPLLTFFYVLIFGVFIIFLSAVFRWRRYFSVKCGPGEAKFPLDLSWLASYPMSLAQSIVFLPVTLAALTAVPGYQALAYSFLSRGHIMYYALLGLLTVLISRFYMLVLAARPGELGRLFARYGVKVSGLTEGSAISEFLRVKLNKIALLTGGLLFALRILPDIVGRFLSLSNAMLSVFTGISVLIVLGILFDMAAQLRAKIEMEQTGRNTTCDVVPVEIEARVKKCFLESRGIPCTIEPYGFTWGLPVRTAGSYYKLNVEHDRVKDAANLLGDEE